MRYISTRGTAPILTFEEAMLTGLARDGGLYVPETVPVLTQGQISAMAGKSYEDVAFDVMRLFIGDTFTDAEFRTLIDKAYASFGHAARAPLVQLDSNHYLLELFHGPTLAFKDFAMQLIGQMFQAALTRSGNRVTIVGASPAIQALPRSRRSVGSNPSMFSSCTRTGGYPRCSDAR